MAAFAGFGEVVRDHGGEFFFGVAVAVASGAVSRRDFGLLVGIGEELDQGKDVVGIRIFGIFEGRRVRDDTTDLFLECLAFVEEADGVTVALRHFASVEARHHRHVIQDVGFRDGEDGGVGAKGAIEALGGITGDLDVLLLILPDRHERAAVDQNVGGLEDGIVEQPRVGREPLRHLILVGDRFFELRDGGERVENPGQFVQLRHVALDEEVRLLRVEAEGEVGGGYVEGKLPERLGIVHRRHRVIVDDEKVRLVPIMKGDVLPDRPEVVADMQRARGLNAGYDNGLGECGRCCFHLCDSV